MVGITSEKQNITNSVDLFLGRCHNYLQKVGSVYVVSDTDGHIFSDLDAIELSNDVVTSETNNSTATHLLPETGHNEQKCSAFRNQSG